MNAMNPISGTDTALPVNLDQYRQQMQDRATRVESMLHTISACIDDPARRDICIALVEDAQVVAKELNHGLDCLNFDLTQVKVAAPGPRRRDLHDDVAVKIDRALGLANGLYQLIHEHTVTRHPDDTGRSLLSLSTILEDALREVAQLHEAEGDAA